MAVTANEHNSTNCLDNITGGYGDDGSGNDLYSINVDISYIGNTDPDTGIPSLQGHCSRELSTTAFTKKSPLNIIIDVFVSYKDLAHPDDLNMTYHRRSLQKI